MPWMGKTKATDKEFVLKEIDDKDHRKKSYKLAHDQKKDVIFWVDNHPIKKL